MLSPPCKCKETPNAAILYFIKRRNGECCVFSKEVKKVLRHDGYLRADAQKYIGIPINKQMFCAKIDGNTAKRNEAWYNYFLE